VESGRVGVASPRIMLTRSNRSSNDSGDVADCELHDVDTLLFSDSC
jgi:hypothetical protein